MSQETLGRGNIEAVLTPTLSVFDETHQGIANVHEAREKAKTNPA